MRRNCQQEIEGSSSSGEYYFTWFDSCCLVVRQEENPMFRQPALEVITTGLSQYGQCHGLRCKYFDANLAGSRTEEISGEQSHLVGRGRAFVRKAKNTDQQRAVLKITQRLSCAGDFLGIVHIQGMLA